jgi:hypothetical protein
MGASATIHRVSTGDKLTVNMTSYVFLFHFFAGVRNCLPSVRCCHDLDPAPHLPGDIRLRFVCRTDLRPSCLGIVVPGTRKIPTSTVPLMSEVKRSKPISGT